MLLINRYTRAKLKTNNIHTERERDSAAHATHTPIFYSIFSWDVNCNVIIYWNSIGIRINNNT